MYFGRHLGVVMARVISIQIWEGKGTLIKVIGGGTCVQVESAHDPGVSLRDPWAVSRLKTAEWINPTKVQRFLHRGCTAPFRSSLIRCLQEHLLSRPIQACSRRVLSWALSPPAAYIALEVSSWLCNCSLRFGKHSIGSNFFIFRNS